jgi:hypothetical protein
MLVPAAKMEEVLKIAKIAAEKHVVCTILHLTASKCLALISPTDWRSK